MISKAEVLYPLINELAAEISRIPGVAKIMLFGSYAKGTQTPESDIDIAVFFDLDKTCFLNEYRALSKLCCSFTQDVQIQAFGLYELDDPSGIVEEIVAFGIELPIDQSLRRTRVWKEYSSTVPKQAIPKLA
ncbi:MAG: nucleotidyltransferase family protein [Christensenellales bacterium]